MHRSIHLVAAFSLVLIGAAPAVAGAAGAPAEAAVSAAAPAAGPGESVIVMLRHQYGFPDTAAGSRQRVAAVGAAGRTDDPDEF